MYRLFKMLPVQILRHHRFNNSKPECPYLTASPPQGGPQEQPAQGFEGLSNAMMPMATEPMAANAGLEHLADFKY